MKIDWHMTILLLIFAGLWAFVPPAAIGFVAGCAYMTIWEEIEKPAE